MPIKSTAFAGAPQAGNDEPITGNRDRTAARSSAVAACGGCIVGVSVDSREFDAGLADLFVDSIADGASCARAGQELVTVLPDALGAHRDFGVMRNRLDTLVAH